MEEKVTLRFTIKFLLWMILFFIVGAIIVGVIFGGAMSDIGSSFNGLDDVEDAFGAIKGFIYGLVLVDLIAALLATKLSIGGVAKKVKITSENRAKILKKMMIVLIVIAIIVIIIHTVIVKSIDKMIVEDLDYDSLGEVIKDAEDESDTVAKYFGVDAGDDYDDLVKLLKGFNNAGHVYSISGLLYAAMIPVANILLKKKEENS